MSPTTLPIDFSAQPWWAHCVPLHEVLRHVGHAEKRERLSALQHEASFLTLVNHVKEHEDPRAGFMEEIDRMNRLSVECRTLMDGQKRLVLSGLRSGTFRAFGYQYPRSADHKPIEVPLDLWNGFIRWENSEVERDGLKIVSVRVTTTQAILLAPQEHQPSPPSRGRPSRQQEIIKAYDDLVRMEQLSPSATNEEKANAIRTLINSRSPSPTSRNDGLSIETVRKALAQRTQNTKS